MSGPEAHPHPIPAEAQDAFDAGAREYVAGHNERALDQLALAIASHRDFGDAYYLLALAQLRAGQRDEARASLVQAVSTSDNALLREYAQRKLASLDIEENRRE